MNDTDSSNNSNGNSNITAITPEFDSTLIREFSMSSPITIGKYLHNMQEEENEVYIYFNEGQQSFVTEILGMDLSNGHVWLGRPYDKNLLSGLNEHTEFVAVAFPENIKLQFQCKGILQSVYEGGQALRIEVPKSMVRLQRRNYFRVMADEEMMAHLHIEDDGLKGDYELVDISLAGCGISVPTRQQFKVGQIIASAKLVVPDGSPPLKVKLTVKNIKTNPDNNQDRCVGCEMILLIPKEESRLQRFLLAAERRQRDHRNSID
ncbi:MAG: flagellar brake protein [Limnobacter sp.]|nr:flagellar brake protein [Limnobacter sp.]